MYENLNNMQDMLELCTFVSSKTFILQIDMYGIYIQDGINVVVTLMKLYYWYN